MQTLVFGSSLLGVISKLKIRELHELLNPVLAGPNIAISESLRDQFSKLAFEFQMGFQSLSKTERDLAVALELDEFASTSQLASMIGKSVGGRFTGDRLEITLCL